MIDAVWLQVLQRIPADSHDCLSIMTLTGAELVVQNLFKLERDFAVVRARTSGTTDAGRTTIIAYSQIDYVALNKKMSEEDVMAIFGPPMPEIAPPQTVIYQAAPPAATTIPFAPMTPRPGMPPPRPAPAATPAPAPVATVTEPAAEPVAQPKPGQISKTLLLARLRERLAEKGK